MLSCEYFSHFFRGEPVESSPYLEPISLLLVPHQYQHLERASQNVCLLHHDSYTQQIQVRAGLLLQLLALAYRVSQIEWCGNGNQMQGKKEWSCSEKKEYTSTLEIYQKSVRAILDI